jgi:hypothetical protein
MIRLRHALPVLGLLCLPACQTQFFLQHDQSDLVTTNVLVESVPTGGWVSFDGVGQAAAPVRIPVQYTHTEQVWSRQTNHGASMRENWSTVGVVLGFPIWGIASFFHYTETVRRHVYSGNRHEVTATMKGRSERTRTLELQGEDEIRVELELVAE